LCIFVAQTYGAVNGACTSAFAMYPGVNVVDNTGETHAADYNHCYESKNVWYRIALPAGNNFRGNIRVTDFAGDSVIGGVYVGNDCSTLSYLGCNDDYYGLLSNIGFDFAATAGQYLYVSIGSYGGGNAATGHFNLTLSQRNGECTGANSMVIGSNEFNTNFETDAVDYSHCYEGKNVWYRYQVPTTGNYFATVRVNDFTGYDSTIGGIYVGSDCGSLTYYGCNDDSNGLLSYKEATVSVSAGQYIYVSVGSFSGGQVGTGHFTFNLGAANGDCSRASTAVLGSNAFDTTYETDAIADYNHCYESKNVWFRYPLTAGTFQATVSITDYTGNHPAIGGVYVGSGCGYPSWTYFGCNDDSNGLLSSKTFTFTATAGQYLFISIGAFSSNPTGTGHFALSVQNIPQTRAHRETVDAYTFCSQQTIGESGMGYFCGSDNTVFYQCLDGAFLSQSSILPCDEGTRCGCADGVECSCGMTSSPCVSFGQTQEC